MLSAKYLSLIIIINLSFSVESYFIMYPEYDKTIFDKLIIDNFYENIENSIITKCNECTLIYNLDKIKSNNFEHAYELSEKINYNKVIIFKIIKNKLLYYILSTENNNQYSNSIIFQSQDSLNDVIDIIIDEFVNFNRIKKQGNNNSFIEHLSNAFFSVFFEILFKCIHNLFRN